jgi:hypothetical protein
MMLDSLILRHMITYLGGEVYRYEYFRRTHSGRHF